MRFVNLEALTKMPIEPPLADKRNLDLDERLVDVIAPLVTHPQPPRALLPAKRALHHPAEAPQLLAGLNLAPGNARRDPALSEAAPQLLSS